MAVVIPHFTYGDRVRRIRQSQHLTQGQFAAEVGVSQAIISRHEMMDAPPVRNRKTLALLIELRFGIPAHWTLTGGIPPQRAALGTREYQDLPRRPTRDLIRQAA